MQTLWQCRTRAWLLTVCLWLLLPGCVSPPPAEESAAESDSQAPAAGRPHGDHSPRHGGQFFMSQDLEHHLEGSLSRSGEFRVHLYDARTQPLPAEALEQTWAALHHGESADTPAFPVRVTDTHLSFAVGSIEVPCTFTLMIRFPGWSERAEPELFTFVFDDFSN